MMQKDAIMSHDAQILLLAHAKEEGIHSYVPVWLMMRLGMHPRDLRKELTFTEGTLKWQRAKNHKPRKETIPAEMSDDLTAWLKDGRRYSR